MIVYLFYDDSYSLVIHYIDYSIHVFIFYLVNLIFIKLRKSSDTPLIL